MPQRKPWLEEAEAILAQYCEQRIPEDIRDKLRLTQKTERGAITLIEVRPHFQRPGEWTESPVARFRYTMSDGYWRLYWMDGSLHWRLLEGCRPARRFQTLLAKVDQDEFGVFWG